MRLFLLVLLVVAGSARPSAQSPASGWGGAAGYSVEAFRTDREAWQQSRVAVQRRFAAGAASLEAGHWRRNGATDLFLATDLYRAAGAAGYGNLRVQVAPGSEAIARTDVLGEGYVSLGGGWEGSVGVRHLTFASNAVALGTGSVARYAGNWLVRARVVVSPGEATGVSTALSARYLVDGVGGLTAPFVEATVGQGQEPVVAPGAAATIRRSWVVAVRGQRPVLGPVGLSLSGSYTADGTLTRWGADIGLVTRF